MVVSSEAGGIGTKVIKTKYPVVEGTSLGTTKLSDEVILEPEKNLTPGKNWGSI